MELDRAIGTWKQTHGSIALTKANQVRPFTKNVLTKATHSELRECSSKVTVYLCNITMKEIKTPTRTIVGQVQAGNMIPKMLTS